MTVIDRVRAYLAGPAAVGVASETWGIPAEEWSPGEYGDYIATSNAVYTCATRRAELLAQLPLRLYRDDEEVTGGVAVERLERPNPKYSGSWLRELTQLDMDLWGRAFWLVEEGAREIWRVRPDRMVVVPSRTDYIAGYYMVDEDTGQHIPWDAESVIYFRYPNPLDELSGLSPMVAARLAADTGSAAMKANYALFENGMLAAGIIQPPEEQKTPWTAEQIKELERDFSRRMRGVDKAHRWAVVRQRLDVEPLGFSPKDAQHLEMMKWSLEEVARAYRFPIDLLRGETTYENQDSAMRSVYTHGVIPAAWRMASVVTDQLLPLLQTEGTRAEFDTSGVEVLQENRGELVEQIATLAEKGVPLNKLLAEFMPQMLPESGGYEWGDVAWMPSQMVPISGPEIVVAPPGTVPTADAPVVEDSPAAVDQDTQTESYTREFGDAEHRAAWEARLLKTAGMEREFQALVTDLFHDQRRSVLAKLAAGADIDTLFDMKRWVRTFRTKAKPFLLDYAETGYEEASEETRQLAAVLRFILRRAQGFAVPVNETTWAALKVSLAEGMTAGESIRDLSDRVTDVMAWRIRSSAETIARTEVIGAYNGGSLIGAKAIGARYKKWNSALTERTRESHASAHGQIVAIKDDFSVGGGSGPAPGQIGLGEEDINCRCWLTYTTTERPG